MEAPRLFGLLGDQPGTEETELTELARLQGTGLAVAPVMVVPALEEELFYRHANLVPQLTQVFRDVDPTDPDEEDLEDLAPEAMRLIRESYLLDEVIDRFYDSLADMPVALRVRRPGDPGLTAGRGRPALLALKRVWAAEWQPERMLARVATLGSFALEARPVLVHGTDVPADEALTAEVEGVLGRQVKAFVTGTGLITRLG